MFGPWLELLTAAVLWLAAAALTAAAAMRCARASLYAPPFGLSELYLRFFLILAMLTAWPVALLGFAGWLGPAGLLLLGAVFFLGSRLLPERPHGVTVLRRRGKRLRLLGVPLVAALAILAVDLPLYLAAPPIRWDAMTYHLYFPARWIQEGQIHHIPTVFSDNSAAFAPQNGALLFAWSMALLGSDALCNVMQLLALAAVGCAVYRLSRELGSAPGAAALAAATLFWVRPLRQVVLSANVDGWMLAFWIAGLAWLVAYVRRGRLDLLLACALATGFAAGTKTIGLPLAAAHLVVLLAATMARRRPAHASALFAAAAAGGGWWLLRNAALYSNPLFPLHLELGPWALRGAYGVEALRAGEFHLEDPGAVLTFVFSYWGAAPCVLLVVGLLGLGSIVMRSLWRREVGRAIVGLVIFVEAAGWFAYYVLEVPHNNQVRFLLPTLIAACVGWGALLHAVGRWRRPVMEALGILGLGVIAVSGRPDVGWLFRFDLMRETGAPILLLMAASTVTGGLLLGLTVVRRRRPRVALASMAVAGVLATLMIGVRCADVARPAFLTHFFHAWAAGSKLLHDPELPPLRIAYTGGNVPYALMGPRFRHRVVYYNTRGAAADGFYEFWRRNPRRYSYHKPGIYRGPDDDFSFWWANLERQRVDWVVIFAMHPAEQSYLPTDAEGFPAERRWVAEHPEHFETLLRHRRLEIHRVRR